MDCKPNLDACECKRYTAVLAANLALRTSGLPVDMVKEYGLPEKFEEPPVVYATEEGTLGMRWPSWKEGLFFIIASSRGAGVFDQQASAQHWREVFNATFSKLVASWERGVYRKSANAEPKIPKG